MHDQEMFDVFDEGIGSLDGIENKISQGSHFLKEDRYKKDTKHRGFLTYWVVFVVTIWLGFILCLLIKRGHLSDSVLSVVLATTTLNVLGLSFIVLYGYFPKKEL